MAPTPLKSHLSKFKSSPNTHGIAKRPKDSLIINRQRFTDAKSPVDKMAAKTPSGNGKAKQVATGSTKEDSVEGNDINLLKEEDSEDDEDEAEDKILDKVADSDDEEDSTSDSDLSAEDELSEPLFRRIVSQLSREDLTEAELAALEELGGVAQDSDSAGGSGSIRSSDQSDGSELSSDEEDEEKEDKDESMAGSEEEADGIEYEKMQVDSDNEDLGAIVKRKVVKNDEKALLKLLDIMKERSGLQMDFFETQTIQSSTSAKIEDVNDDIGLEVQLYKEALQTAKEAYTNFENASKPFFRPDDYFAEMIKSDAHMEKIRLKLISEAENIKASEESKKKRNLKKFGKAIQVEKKLEREKESKRVKEGVKELRKKRKDVPSLGKTDEIDFDIALEETLSNKRARYDDDKDDKASGSKRKPKMNRVGREQKFGRPKPKGVTGRRWKENTKESSNHFEGMGGRGDGKITSGSASSGRARGTGGRGGSSGRGRCSGGRGAKSKRPGKSLRVSKR